MAAEVEAAVDEARVVVVVRWDPAVVQWDPAVVQWDLAVVRWDPAVARWVPAVVRWDPAVVRWDPAVVVEAQVAQEAHLPVVEAAEVRLVRPHLMQWLHCPSGRACFPRGRRCMTFH